MGQVTAGGRSRRRSVGIGRLGIVRRLLAVVALFAAGASFAQTPPVLTVPSTSTTPPVVLLNGFQLQCPGSSSSTFGDLERLLGTAVYFFDNCECPNCTIEEFANDFGQALNLIRYDNGEPVPRVDVVAHSMGGLIVRAYLAGKQETSGKFFPVSNPRIRKVIFTATPHFGSYQAAGPLATFLPSQIQANEMKPGSQFLLD